MVVDIPLSICLYKDIYVMRCAIWYHLYNFIKTWKTPMEECYFLKVTFLHGCFSRFSYCTNGIKSRKTSHMDVCITSYFEIKALKSIIINIVKLPFEKFILWAQYITIIMSGSLNEKNLIYLETVAFTSL